MQPIDTWVRKIGQHLWPEFDGQNREIVDVFLAARIVAETKRLKLSAVDFNQGAWYFGAHCVKKSRILAEKLKALEG